VLEEETDGGSFAAFKKRLGDSVGKFVTVVFHDEERTNTFTFIVEGLAKWRASIFKNCKVDLHTDASGHDFIQRRSF
jgi:hypothetical protein